MEAAAAKTTQNDSTNTKLEQPTAAPAEQMSNLAVENQSRGQSLTQIKQSTEALVSTGTLAPMTLTGGDTAPQKTLPAPDAAATPAGSVHETKSTDWIVPADVTSVNIDLKGGAGGGGGAFGPYDGGDGGLGQKVEETVAVKPGDDISVSVAEGGNGGDGGAYGGGGGGAGGEVTVSLDGKSIGTALGGGGGGGGAGGAPGDYGQGGDAGSSSWAGYGGGGGAGGHGSVDISWN